MASLLKNQIIKHLAKFFKNLSVDSLDLSLRGTCHLNNLELNETFLMEIFEFPVFLNLKKAVVNKCFINVPYTQIKSKPCQLILDQVFIEVETIENFRQNTNYFKRLSNLGNGKYGLGERIIDGLTVKIDSVEVHFTSSAFNAQLTLLQIVIESRLPNWKQANNISQTKIKDTKRNQILIFKYIEWQSLRFEARSEVKSEEFQSHSSPLRLITRNGICKVVLKKNLLDCSTISARIQLNFDDLLWILTDSTIVNFIHLLNYITQLMNKAPMNKKNNIIDVSPTKVQALIKNSRINTTDMSCLFSQYDVLETSMHLMIGRLQLHLSDDLNRSSFSSLQNGGGLHVILQKLLIDFYPYHKAIASRLHWLYYTDSIYKSTIEPFINIHLKSFFDINGEAKNYSNLFSKIDNWNNIELNKRLKDLLSFVILIRVGNYKVNCVSTSTNEKSEKCRDKKFGKDECILISPGAIPKDLPAVYIEINQFYYMEPGSTRSSTRIKSPKPTLYINIAPSLINFDIVTFLWFNAFYSSIHQSLLKFASTLPQTENNSEFHILAEIILPTFSINLKNLYNGDNDLPINSYEILELKSTKISIKNSKGNVNDLEKLNNLFSKLRSSRLFNQTREYPWMNNKEVDFNYKCDHLIDSLLKEIKNCESGFNNKFLIINFQPIWLDLKQSNHFISNTVEPFDLTFWIQINKNSHQTIEPDLNIYCCFPDLKLHIDHYSYLFFIRLIEKLEYFSNILKSDFSRIQDNDKEVGEDLKSPLVIISTILPHIELFAKLNIFDNDSIQSNFSDNSVSLLLPDESVLDKDDFYMNSSSVNSNNDTYASQINDQSNNFNVNNQQSTNPFIDQLEPIIQSESNIEKAATESVSINRMGNAFIGLFNNKNGQISIGNIDNSPSVEDDTRSIKSDLSIESEKIILNLEDDAESFVFRSMDNEESVEEAVEITEDIKYDINIRPTTYFDKKSSHLTYMKLTLRNINLLNQNKNFIATILVSIHEIEINTYFKVPYNQFLKDSSSMLAPFKPINYLGEPNLLARIDTDTKSLTSNKDDKEMITVILQHLDLKTLDKRFVDSLMNDFLADKDARDVSKIKILLDDLKLKIKDEQLKTPIIDLCLNNLLIDRETSNKIHIGPFISSTANKLLISHQNVFNRLSVDLNKLDEFSNNHTNDNSNEFTKENYLRLLEENRKLKLGSNL